MLLVVADTGPLRYLVQIQQIGILPSLFEKIYIPTAVYDELCHASTPETVRHWAQSHPQWLEVAPVAKAFDPAFEMLDEGEKAALSLGNF